MTNNNILSINIINIANPSLIRAEKIWNFLKRSTKYDVIAMTETKTSDGCKYLIETAEKNGYSVFGNLPPKKEYGSLIFMRSNPNIKITSFPSKLPYLHERLTAIEVEIGINKFNILNVYIPSRDMTLEKIERKKKFIYELKKFLKLHVNKNTIFCGDWNIVSKLHTPRYPIFQDWEYNFFDYILNINLRDSHTGHDKMPYSWVGRTGNGYRYDYAFVGQNIHVEKSIYCDKAKKDGLTDHKSIILEILKNDKRN